MFLNLDAGERPDENDDLWSLFDVLNCACAGHAGDAASMDRVAAFCARSAVKLGAHPSYSDREGFGRRSPLQSARASDMAIRVRDVATLVEPVVSVQCRSLVEAAHRRGIAVVTVKPHGALYHDANVHAEIARAFLRGAIAAIGRDVTIVGPPTGALADEAARVHLHYAREGFADRRMLPDGTLVPRTDPDALIVDPAEAAAQASVLAASVDTICIHSDTPGAFAIARAVRRVLCG